MKKHIIIISSLLIVNVLSYHFLENRFIKQLLYTILYIEFIYMIIEQYKSYKFKYKILSILFVIGFISSFLMYYDIKIGRIFTPVAITSNLLFAIFLIADFLKNRDIIIMIYAIIIIISYPLSFIANEKLDMPLSLITLCIGIVLIIKNYNNKMEYASFPLIISSIQLLSLFV